MKEFLYQILEIIKIVYSRQKSLTTILFFLIVHFLSQLGVFGLSDQILEIVYRIKLEYGLNFFIEILIDILVLFFGGSQLVVFTDFVLILIFLFLIKYQIDKNSLQNNDLEDIKLTKKNTEEILLVLDDIKNKKNLNESDQKIISKGLKKIIKRCRKYARNGQPNRVIDILNQLKHFISINNEQDVYIDFLTLEAKAYQEAEKIEEAIIKNKEIIKEFSKEIRPYLYLADIYLQVDNYDSFGRYYKKAKEITPDHPVIYNLKYVKRLKTEKKIEIPDDEIWGEDGTWERAHCYYIHSISLQQDKDKRDSYLEKAIETDSSYIHYKIQKVGFKIFDLLALKNENSDFDFFSEAIILQKEIESLENYTVKDDVVKRKLEIERLKMNFFFLQHPNADENKIRQNLKTLLSYILGSYFDSYNDNVLCEILDGAQSLLSKDVIENILVYIENSRKKPSKNLLFILAVNGITYFNDYSRLKKLCKIGKAYEEKELLEAIESGNKQTIKEKISKFEDNKKVKIIISIKEFEFKIDLINSFINKIGNDWKSLLHRVQLGLLYDNKEYDAAIEVVKKINIKKADPIICRLAFEVAKFIGIYPNIERDTLQRLLMLGAYPQEEFSFLANLVIAQYNLGEFPDALSNGKKVLENKDKISPSGQSYILFICLDILLSDGNGNDAFNLSKQYSDVKKDFRLYIKESEIYLAKKLKKESIEAAVNAIKSVEKIDDQCLGAVSYQLMIIQNIFDFEFERPKIISDGVFVKLEKIEDWFFMGEGSPLNAVQLNNKNDRRYKALINVKLGDKIEWAGDDGRMVKIKRKVEDIRIIEDYIGFQGFKLMEKMGKAGSPYMKMIEVGTTPESIKESMLKFMGKENECYKMYVNNKLPFSFYISLVGNIGEAFSKIRFNKKGFVNINFSQEDINSQKEKAIMAIQGRKVFIDGTSLFMLLESGSYKKVLSNLPDYYVPFSAMLEYKRLIEKFSNVPKRGSMQIGMRGSDVHFSQYDQESSEKIKEVLCGFNDYINKNAKIFGVADSERNENEIEKRILPSVSDACIKAQQKDGDVIVMTEDFSYLTYNSRLTGKNQPIYFSLWVIIRVLLDSNKITWDEYLETFHWLTVYRERFLPTSAEEIIKCMFVGTENNLIINPKNIDKLNLNLIWSEEYGTNINSVINVASDVVLYLLKNFSVTDNQLEIIFPKLYIPILNKRNKIEWGNKFLSICRYKINHSALIHQVNIDIRYKILENRVYGYITKRKD